MDQTVESASGQWKIAARTEEDCVWRKPEFVPIEHLEKHGNKIVTVVKMTPYAYVIDVKKKVLDFVEGSSRSQILTAP